MSDRKRGNALIALFALLAILVWAFVDSRQPDAPRVPAQDGSAAAGPQPSRAPVGVTAEDRPSPVERGRVAIPAEGQERARRIRGLIEACSSSFDERALRDAWLGEMDLAAFQASVLASGVTAAELMAAIAENDFAVLAPAEHDTLLLAMAFATGFTPEHATFLAAQLGDSHVLLDERALGNNRHDANALMAATHALRLRGELQLANDVVSAAAQRMPHGVAGSMAFTGANEALLAMVLAEGRPDDPRIQQLVALLRRGGVVRAGGALHAAFGKLLAADENAFFSAMDAAVTGQDGTASCALALLNEDRHVARLQRILTAAQSQLRLERSAEAAAMAAFAIGEPNTMAAAFQWIEDPRRAISTEMRVLATTLPVDRTARCAAMLAGRIEGRGNSAAVFAALDKDLERRAQALRLSPQQRERTFSALQQAADSGRLTPAGRSYCLRLMGRLGTLGDCEHVERLGHRLRIPEEAAAAVHAIRERQRR